jgi:hypothetical protein
VSTRSSRLQSDKSLTAFFGISLTCRAIVVSSRRAAVRAGAVPPKFATTDGADVQYNAGGACRAPPAAAPDPAVARLILVKIDADDALAAAGGQF